MEKDSESAQHLQEWNFLGSDKKRADLRSAR
jgi:hypothetical protein